MEGGLTACSVLTGNISCEAVGSSQASSLSTCKSKWDLILGGSSFRVFDFSVDLTLFFFFSVSLKVFDIFYDCWPQYPL